MAAYYNENDAHAAQWLRNLIAEGAIAPGEVDERDIRDVRPSELAGYTQCHFFAGIGVWSYSLRRAGWPDDRAVWTGSCPCQPFSAAGKGGGFDDERHLWPSWHWLIEQCRPVRIYGEQVASKDGLAWLDLVQADLEGSGYASRAFDLCAAGFGAPHIRQRLFFVVDAESERLQRRPDDGDGGRRQRAFGQGCETGGVEHATRDGRDERRPEPSERGIGAGCGSGGLADTDGGIAGDRDIQRGGQLGFQPQDRSLGPSERSARPGPTNGFWRAADWLGCTDGKWRPVEPDTFPLVDGAAFRVGSGRADLEGKSRPKMLRGYGNAINAEVAAEFIKISDDAAVERLRI